MAPSTSSDAPFGRMLTAMVTPMTADGAVDYDGAARLATHLVDERRHDGLVLSGTTGESPTTSDAEKEQLVRVVLDAVGDRATVVAGVGTNDTAHSIELAGQAERAGAHALLVVTPYYNKPPQAGLMRYFTAVADATGLPNMLYDIPGRTGTAIHTETLVRLAEHPRIVAVKDAKGDLFGSSDVMSRSGLVYYSGDDALNLAWLAHGGVGIVSVIGHAAPRKCADLVEAMTRGDLVEARRIHQELLPVVRAIMTRTQGAIAAKAALQLQGVLTNRTMRRPLIDLTESEVAVLRADLAAAALL
ncbi:MAG: 4-hydroxy-tetrahydrodipicolinate synthase [Actinomadura sp.]